MISPTRHRWALPVVAAAAALVAACAAPSDGSAGDPDATPAPGGRPAIVAPTTAPPPSTYVTARARLGIDGCPIYPRDNVFAATVTRLPVRADSARVIASMGGSSLVVRPAFSAEPWQGSRSGVPINVADSRTTPLTDVRVGTHAYLSDATGHPIPASPRIEGWPGMAWDRHLLVVDTATCTSSELFYVTPPSTQTLGRWTAETAVKIDLRTNTPRATGSATASGTSMLAGMVRYDEVAAGEIDHVVGIAVPKISTGDPIWPATFSDGRSSDPDAPAMGSWLRLRADVDISRLSPQARVVAQALRDHGAVVLDTTNAGMALLGEPDVRWSDGDLASLRTLDAADFEVIDASPMKVADGSYAIR